MIKICYLLYLYIFLSVAVANGSVDMIIVEKSMRILKLMEHGSVIKKYSIDLGFDPIGHKHFRGDGKTPEGLYYVSKKSTNSDFHLSLQISYPNKWDKRNARVFNKDAGNYIMIHGQPNIKNTAHKKDWTNGCIALSNKDINDLNKYVLINTPIYIKK